MSEANQLRKVADKTATWFEANAARNESQGNACRFDTLRDAYLADAKNYRIMARELRSALLADLTASPVPAGEK